jgi:hypothetical protein
MILRKFNLKELTMFERSDGLMRGSREERMQEVSGFQESDWDFHTLLGIIQGFLDHAENVRLAAMETLLEIAGRRKAPMSLTPVSVIEYFMFSFTASSMAAQRIFKFLIENTDIPGANEAIERALLSDFRNEDFEQFIDIILKAKKVEVLKTLEHKKLSKRKTQILKNALKNVNGKTKEEISALIEEFKKNLNSSPKNGGFTLFLF